MLSFLRKNGYKKILYIFDKKIYETNSYFQNHISRYCKKYIFYKSSFEPTYDDLKQGLDEAKKFKDLDAICGIGGGSTMDYAKGLAILLTNKQRPETLAGFPSLKNSPIPVITIPTIPGSGSEITYNASFVNKRTMVKMGINSLLNYPRICVLDPFLARSAPFNALRSSVCDALVHAIEGYLSPLSSCFSKTMSFCALKILFTNGVNILAGSKKICDWQSLQLCSIFSMLSLSNSSSGPSGAFSYYLGPQHQIPHGLAGGFFLRHILKITYSSGNRSLEELKINGKGTLTCVLKLLRMAKVPVTLSGLGIKKMDKKEFLEFSKGVMAARRLHVIPFTNDMVEKLIKEIS